jgi:hypothetical protein
VARAERGRWRDAVGDDGQETEQRDGDSCRSYMPCTVQTVGYTIAPETCIVFQRKGWIEGAYSDENVAIRTVRIAGGRGAHD